MFNFHQNRFPTVIFVRYNAKCLTSSPFGTLTYENILYRICVYDCDAWVTVKTKLTLCLTKYHAMMYPVLKVTPCREDIGRSGGKFPCILNVGARGK
jgi:hypothetical protein